LLRKLRNFSDTLYSIFYLLSQLDWCNLFDIVKEFRKSAEVNRGRFLTYLLCIFVCCYFCFFQNFIFHPGVSLQLVMQITYRSRVHASLSRGRRSPSDEALAFTYPVQSDCSQRYLDRQIVRYQ